MNFLPGRLCPVKQNLNDDDDDTIAKWTVSLLASESGLQLRLHLVLYISFIQSMMVYLFIPKCLSSIP